MERFVDFHGLYIDPKAVIGFGDNVIILNGSSWSTKHSRAEISKMLGYE